MKCTTDSINMKDRAGREGLLQKRLLGPGKEKNMRKKKVYIEQKNCWDRFSRFIKLPNKDLSRNPSRSFFLSLAGFDRN